jgi:hypothetical protein
MSTIAADSSEKSRWERLSGDLGRTQSLLQTVENGRMQTRADQARRCASASSVRE